MSTVSGKLFVYVQEKMRETTQIWNHFFDAILITKTSVAEPTPRRIEIETGEQYIVWKDWIITGKYALNPLTRWLTPLLTTKVFAAFMNP